MADHINHNDGLNGKAADLETENSDEGTAVVIVLFWDNFKVLLLKRAPQCATQGWCLPGGHVGEEESISAAVRELKEETGYDVSADSLFLVGYDHSSKGLSVAIYRADVNYKPIRLSPEHTAAIWHTAYIWTKNLGLEDELAGRTQEFIQAAFEHRIRASRMFLEGDI